MTATTRYNGMSDEAVVRATGKAHEQWFGVLDASGAAELSHRDIAARLVEDHGVDGWWAQHVTVAYEHARGRRTKHQTPDGFQVSKSKTLAVPAAQVFEALVDEATRDRWLDLDLDVTSATPGRYVHGRAGDTRVSFTLTAKGDARTLVAVQQRRLVDAEAAEQAKASWAARLQRLADLLT